jgi:hypothetical protein
LHPQPDATPLLRWLNVVEASSIVSFEYVARLCSSSKSLGVSFDADSFRDSFVTLLREVKDDATVVVVASSSPSSSQQLDAELDGIPTAGEAPSCCWCNRCQILWKKILRLPYRGLPTGEFSSDPRRCKSRTARRMSSGQYRHLEVTCFRMVWLVVVCARLRTELG